MVDIDDASVRVLGFEVDVVSVGRPEVAKVKCSNMVANCGFGLYSSTNSNHGRHAKTGKLSMEQMMESMEEYQSEPKNGRWADGFMLLMLLLRGRREGRVVKNEEDGWTMDG